MRKFVSHVRQHTLHHAHDPALTGHLALETRAGVGVVRHERRDGQDVLLRASLPNVRPVVHHDAHLGNVRQPPRRVGERLLLSAPVLHADDALVKRDDVVQGQQLPGRVEQPPHLVSVLPLRHRAHESLALGSLGPVAGVLGRGASDRVRRRALLIAAQVRVQVVPPGPDVDDHAGVRVLRVDPREDHLAAPHVRRFDANRRPVDHHRFLTPVRVRHQHRLHLRRDPLGLPTRVGHRHANALLVAELRE